MMRWFVFLLITFCVEAADLPDTWRHWQYFRPLPSPGEPSSWLQTTLPPEIFGPAQTGLADLRVINRSGKEVPYLLQVQQDRCQCAWRNAPISDTGFIPEKYSQAIIDTGTSGAPHNAVQITLDQTDFFTWTEISASEDRLHWRVVRDKAPLFRFEQGPLTDGQILTYPRTRSRWLKLRFLHGEKALQASAAHIAEHNKSEARYIPLPAIFSPTPEPVEGESRWEVDMDKLRSPVSAIRFTTKQAEFHRQVKINISDDGKNWRNVGQGHIYRHVDGDKQDSELDVVFPERQARYWRVSLLNRNDPVLPELKLEMLGVARLLVFKPEAGEEYRLLYGNPRASAPHYELAHITRPEQWQTARTAVPGMEQRNIAYVSSAAWSERHPGLLWTALILAVGGLAWIAINALRPGKAGAQEKIK